MIGEADPGAPIPPTSNSISGSSVRAPRRWLSVRRSRTHPTFLDRRLALELHAEFDRERNGSLEVVDNDAEVVHPSNRQIPSTFPGARLNERRRVHPAPAAALLS